MPVDTDVDRATAWLMQADPNPAHARTWMTCAGSVVLPVGRAWAAIRMPEHAALAVAGAGLSGPICHHPPGRSVYFLVPVDATWSGPGTLLDDTHWLALPAPRVIAPPGAYWVQPPDGTGTLVSPERLASALAARNGRSAQ
ncbi:MULTISPECIES: hypothetical protein [unclassified Streptomyces]|uniref:hypothetical protein n=1 Tax=unclassified Streptomyces TaxID=2593676 RepID=UPI00114CD5D6|nr:MULTISPECIES: hypothetical protein [unclassified Streptomyces]MYR28611.1 hypothetical protein [Streptomyces sp. SID4945]